MFGLYYIVRVIVSLATIGYIINIPWAIFYVVSQFVVYMLAFSSSILVGISAAIGYAILFHYELPWWYMLLFGTNVLQCWAYASTSEEVRNGESDELEAIRKRSAYDSMAAWMFWIAFIGMVYQCFFD